MQEREPAGAYKAFKLYWEQGDGRTIAGVVKMSTNARRSIYFWSTKFRWNQRIDEHAIAVRQLWLDATKRQFDKAADALAEARIRYTLKSIEASTLMQTKGMEVVRAINPIESTHTIPGKDGKPMHVTIKPSPNVRLSDGVRLILGANYNLASAEAGIARVRDGDSKHKRTDGSHPRRLATDEPTVVLFLDGGDGVPMPLSTLPPPDELDPYFNPYDGTSTPPSNSPITTDETAEK